MKRQVGFLIGLLVSSMVIAQPIAGVIEKNDQLLRERYLLMKTSSQTFQDYKVIKEYILDGFWKMTMDSIQANRKTLAEANQRINQLENDLVSIKTTLAEQQNAVKDIEYDSKHISLLGIPFTKNVFRGFVFTIIGALIAFIVVLSGYWRVSKSSMKEQKLIVESLTREFEEYKRKALEKQTKLSRELQNERNKLATLDVKSKG
jgi:hypothetical protein